MNPINYLTIDVEDYFQVHAFAKIIRPADWDQYECRVEKNVHQILEILDTYRSIQNSKFKIQNYFRATFFILGWIAERYPKLVKEIHSRGHEIASHGYGHKVIYQQSQEEFREDIRKSKQILEDLTGERVIGYRAPTYSITEKTLWALYILREEGYLYDSSVFPIKHDYYGMPHCPRLPFIWNLDAPTPSVVSLFPEVDAIDQPSTFKIQNGFPNPEQHTTNNGPRTTHNEQRSTDTQQFKTQNSKLKIIYEFPLSTLNLLGQRIPIAGGGYFRLFPYWFTRWALARVNNVEKQPFIFYLHPWEIDPAQPRLNHAGILSRFRHYNNLDKTKHRFAHLLQDFSFTSILNGNPYLQN